MIKVCTKCSFKGSKIFFAKRRNVCKKCFSKANKIYREGRKSIIEKYRENHRKEAKAYYWKNVEKFSSYHKIYRKLNKNRLTVYNAQYKNIRRKNDISYKLRTLISSRIATVIKKNGSIKDRTFVNCVPFIIEALKDHLEKQFEHWMNWKNYGKYNSKTWKDNDPATWTWQLDHIIPQSELPYFSTDSENFQKCWSLNNLRPLSSKQNLLDGINRTRHVKG